MHPGSPSPEIAQLSGALTRVAAGDQGAFHEVYRKTSAKLLGVCLRIFPDRAEAEDVLQDVYLIVWQKAAQFDPGRASPITWLVTIARNRAIDRWRSLGRRRVTPIDDIDEPADDRADVLASLLDAEGEHRMVLCLDELGRGDAALVRTAFYQGATYAELAERSNRPLGTVKSRIRRALLKLRDCLA